MNKTFRIISQFLIIVLIVIAAIVAYGLMNQQNMWLFIIAYWIVLTLKNISDSMGK